MDKPIGMHITSDPDETRVDPLTPGEAEREALRQLRLFLVSDLRGGAPPPDWAAGDHRLSLESPDLTSLLAELRPVVEVSVPNLLGTEPERLNERIEVDSLEVLTPRGLISRIPVLRRAAAVRDALAEARAGRIGREELTERLTEAGLPKADAGSLVQALAAGGSDELQDSSEDSSLARLLGLVDLSGNGEPPARPRTRADDVLDTLVDAAAAGAPPEVDRNTTDGAIADLDRRLNAQVESLLADEDLRRLEAAWRGVSFLAQRADFRGGMRIDVLAAAKGELADALHHQVLMPEHDDGVNRPPLAAIVLDHAFAAKPADAVALADVAALGTSLQVPVIASVDAEFFGFEQPTDLTRLGPLRQHLAADSYIAYRKLREREDGQFLALALPSFLLREPHSNGDWAEAQPLWGGGALLAAAALLSSHTQTGWPTHLEDRRVEDLPVRRTRMGGLPAAVSFADRLAMDLAAAGFFAFRAPLNRDHVVAGYPSVVRRPQGDDPNDARAKSSLPAAVFSALAAHRILRIQEELAGLDEQEAAGELERRMASFIGAEPDGESITVQHLDEHETEEYRVFGIRLRPPKKVLSHSVGLVLGATIPKAST